MNGQKRFPSRYSIASAPPRSIASTGDASIVHDAGRSTSIGSSLNSTSLPALRWPNPSWIRESGLLPAPDAPTAPEGPPDRRSPPVLRRCQPPPSLGKMEKNRLIWRRFFDGGLFFDFAEAVFALSHEGRLVHWAATIHTDHFFRLLFSHDKPSFRFFRPQ